MGKTATYCSECYNKDGRVLQQGRAGRRRSGQGGRSLWENADDRARDLLQVQQGCDRGVLRGVNFTPLDLLASIAR